MDPHSCWNIGRIKHGIVFLGELLLVENYITQIQLHQTEGKPTLGACIDAIVTPKGSILIIRSTYFVLSGQQRRLLQHGNPVIGQLSQIPCACRSKTIMMVNQPLSHTEVLTIDRQGIGSQCIEPEAINLGLPSATHTRIEKDGTMAKNYPAPLICHLSKQIAKFKERVARGTVTNQSIRLRIIYFNTFCLSLFYYVQSIVIRNQKQLKVIYQSMLQYVLGRKWYPALKLAGVTRWLGIGPLLDPYLTQCVSAFGLFHRQGKLLTNQPGSTQYNKQINNLWRKIAVKLPADAVANILAVYTQHNSPHRVAKAFNNQTKKYYVPQLLAESRQYALEHIRNSSWPNNVQMPYLDWLADASQMLVGSVPRFSVLRWVLASLTLITPMNNKIRNLSGTCQEISARLCVRSTMSTIFPQ